MGRFLLSIDSSVRLKHVSSRSIRYANAELSCGAYWPRYASGLTTIPGHPNRLEDTIHHFLNRLARMCHTYEMLTKWTGRNAGSAWCCHCQSELGGGGEREPITGLHGREPSNH